MSRGDVVVFVSPVDRATVLIKRVIAIGGDTVEIRNKELILNGERAPDPGAISALPTGTPAKGGPE